MVEEDALRIVEQIQEYDPRLRVVCLLPEKAEINDAPFILCEEQPDGTYRKVFEFWSLDAQVLERIRLSDAAHTDIIAYLEKLENDIEKQREAQWREKLDAAKDLTAHVAGNRKNAYTFRDDDTGDKVTIYDDRPSERK